MYNTFRATPSWAKIETFILPGSSRSNDVLRQYSGMFIEIRLKGSHSLSKSKKTGRKLPDLVLLLRALLWGLEIHRRWLHWCLDISTITLRHSLKRTTSKANAVILVQWNSPLSVKFLMKCPNKFVRKLVKQTIKAPAIYYTKLGFYLI